MNTENTPNEPAPHLSAELKFEHTPPALVPNVGEIFDAQKTFADLGLRSSVVKGVDAAGFKHPTSIQSTLIPMALTGKDVIGQSKTGTGKTAAFGLPLLHMCN